MSNPRSKGVTLIEVVAALVLAATVLSSTLVAYGRAVKQRSLAERRLVAAELADVLFQQWLSEDGISMPELDSSETTEGELVAKDGSQWIWKIRSLGTPKFGGTTVRQPYVLVKYELELIAKAREQVPRQSMLRIEFAGGLVSDPRLSTGRTAP
ncbi:MAG: prepilin-type N-terminal cleavage/methylation domain-containing protein [Planctomycetota bacterium]